MLSGNNVSNNTYGIYLYLSSKNTLSGNNASNNNYGIWLSAFSNNNMLSGNNASNNGGGIELEASSDNNMLSGNKVSNNGFGIVLYSPREPPKNNVLSGNNVSNNNLGIGLEYSIDNTIFHNNLRNNTIQAIDTDWLNNLHANMWHSGYPTGGNFWSDYIDTDLKSGLNQDQSGSDGIGDAPYPISGSSSVDMYPLMIPFSVGMKGDLNNNGESADAGDLVLMKRASIGEIPADSSYDLNNNGIPADAEDLVLMKRASIGEINL
jgi:parallel beta-helix repeat protein